MTDIPDKFQQLKKAHNKRLKAEEDWKQAHLTLSNDRHKAGGKIFEAQNQVNTLLGELIDMVDQEESNQT